MARGARQASAARCSGVGCAPAPNPLLGPITGEARSGLIRPFARMNHQPFDVQLDWDADALATQWPGSPDHGFFQQRLYEVTVEATRADAAHRLLDVAAGDASYIGHIVQRGPRAVAIDPSPLMLARAREANQRRSAPVMLVRGVAGGLSVRPDRQLRPPSCAPLRDRPLSPTPTSPSAG